MKKYIARSFFIKSVFIRCELSSQIQAMNFQSRSSLSESQSNSNDVWYLLTQTEIQWKGNKYYLSKDGVQ